MTNDYKYNNVGSKHTRLVVDTFESEMENFDQLPQPLRELLRNSHLKLSSSEMLKYTQQFPTNFLIQWLLGEMRRERNDFATEYKAATHQDYPHHAAQVTIQPYGPLIPKHRKETINERRARIRYRHFPSEVTEY